jgi:hypothetical protein
MSKRPACAVVAGQGKAKTMLMQTDERKAATNKAQHATGTGTKVLRTRSGGEGNGNPNQTKFPTVQENLADRTETKHQNNKAKWLIRRNGM